MHITGFYINTFAGVQLTRFLMDQSGQHSGMKIYTEAIATIYTLIAKNSENN